MAVLRSRTWAAGMKSRPATKSTEESLTEPDIATRPYEDSSVTAYRENMGKRGHNGAASSKESLREWSITLERKFADKNMDQLRRSLKLYQFSKRFGTRSSPSRVVHVSEGELNANMLDCLEQMQDSPKTTIRGEAGAIPDRLQGAEVEEEDEELETLNLNLRTVELKPHVFISTKSGGIFPGRVPMSRSGFSVSWPIARCHQELQVAVNRASDLCRLQRIVRNGLVLGVLNLSNGNVRGMAKVTIAQEMQHGGEDLSPWNAPTSASLVLLDIPLNANETLQDTAPLIFARIRCHFESVLEAENVTKPNASSIFLQLARESSEPVYDVLTMEEQRLSRPVSIPTSLLSSSSGEDSVESSGSTRAETRSASFHTSKRPERALREISRAMRDKGYSVRHRQGFGLEVDLAGKQNATTVLFITASRTGLGSGTFTGRASSVVTLQGRVPVSEDGHSVFDQIGDAVEALLNGRSRGRRARN
mmetsp:Transcript_29962/g.72949  ORF Transcript_29962/g.72949 Transcript_29962/m.72949 type:complete len:477 (+) Transcript_29962:586-2016(+)